MANKYKSVVFDCATSGNFCDICYAITRANDEEKPIHWFSKTSENGPPAVKMSETKLASLVHYLLGKMSDGYEIIGWGSQPYDLRLMYMELGEVSGAQTDVLDLTLGHMDLQLNVLAQTGHRVPLNFMANMEVDPHIGAQIPTMWKSGDIEQQREVVNHLRFQVLTIDTVAHILNAQGSYTWKVPNKPESYIFKGNLYPTGYFANLARQLPRAAMTKDFYNPLAWVLTSPLFDTGVHEIHEPELAF